MNSDAGGMNVNARADVNADARSSNAHDGRRRNVDSRCGHVDHWSSHVDHWMSVVPRYDHMTVHAMMADYVTIMSRLGRRTICHLQKSPAQKYQ